MSKIQARTWRWRVFEGTGAKPADQPFGTVAYVLADPGIPVGGTKGASVHVSAICRAMARLGLRVTLYAAKVVGPLAGPGSDGVEVKEFSFGHVPSGTPGERARIAGAAAFYERLDRAMSDRPVDLVIERLSLFARGSGAVAERVGAARLVEVNAPVAQERARHFGLGHAMEAAEAERSALEGASVVAVSGPLADWAISCGAASAAVVANGAEVSALDPDAQSQAGRALGKELGISGAVVVGFVGSLKPWHGVEVLLEAMDHLDAPLVVVGDGPMRESLEAQAHRLGIWSHFVGAVPAPEVPRYLAAMDVSVAPYLPADPFYFSPLKVVEAMAGGLAVVASDFPTVADALGDTGILVPPADPSALHDALVRLLGDGGLRSRLGKAARERAVAQFDWEAVAARVLAHAAHPQPVTPRTSVVAGGLR